MKKRFVGLLMALTLIISCMVPDGVVMAAGAETISFSVDYGQTEARQMFDMLNNYRKSNGKSELVYDYNLERVAMQRAAEIAVRFNEAESEADLRPDGNSYKQTLADYGFDISPRGILYGENILFGTEDSMKLDSAFGKFCSDSGNKDQMLGFYTIVGIAHIRLEEKTDFWVQIFANRGTPGDYTSPIDGPLEVTVKIDPSIVTDVQVDYVSGGNTVPAGSSVAVPVYLPKIKVSGSEMKEALVLSPLKFNSNDGFVNATGNTMTGLKEGSGSISASLLGRTYSYPISVTTGSGVTPEPTSAPTSVPTLAPVISQTPTPTVEPTQSVTTAPTQIVTGDSGQNLTLAPTQLNFDDPFGTSNQEPTQGATKTPTQAPTQTVTNVPTQVVTSTPTSSPTQTVTTVPTSLPTQTVTTVPTQATTPMPTPTTSVIKLKKGDIFGKEDLKYKVTGSKTVSVAGLTSKNITSVTIPATVTISGNKYKVTGITASAFKNKTKLETVKIGKNVKSIGKSAFYGCSNLTKITFAGNAVKSIGKKAFTKVNAKAVIYTPSKSLKTYKKLLNASGSKCSVKKA